MGLFDVSPSLKENNYPWTDEFIESMQEGLWTHKEFSFATDIQDFKTNLTSQEREIIIRALSVISQVEVSVKKYWSKLGDNLPANGLNDLGFVMSYIEVVHNKAYKRLLEALGLQDIFDQNLKIDFIKGRINYLQKHLHKFHADNKKQFIYSLILFTLFVENIALFSQFYTIGWFGKYKNCLKDTNQQVRYTSKEENVHALAGIKIINTLREEYPEFFDKELEEKIRTEAEQAVKYECEIVEWIINGYDHPQLNSILLKEFIKNRMNDSLEQIGYEKIFNINEKLIEETIWFEEYVLGKAKTDFFYSRPIGYSKGQQSFDYEDLI